MWPLSARVAARRDVRAAAGSVILATGAAKDTSFTFDFSNFTGNNKLVVIGSGGGDVFIAGSVDNEKAKELFGSWEEPRPYIRIVPQPSRS